MLELLNQKEKENLKEWKYQVDDPSITTLVLTPFWNTVVKYVPEYVAPNVLSLSGLIMLMYSFYLNYMFFDDYPRAVSGVCAILIFIYQTLDAIDGKHARRIKNSSPLGELFDHACDSVGLIFVALTVARTSGITDLNVLFYIIQSTLMLFMVEHLKAFRTKKVEFFKYTGPGEILLGCIALLLYRCIFNVSIIPPQLVQSNVFFVIYWAVYIYSFYIIFFDSQLGNVGKLFGNERSEYIQSFLNGDDYGTNVGLALSLLSRHINGWLLQFNIINGWDYNDVIAQSMVLSVVISDLIVAKMAKRQLHPTIVVGSMLAVFNHKILIYILTTAYFLKMFSEICESMNLLLFTPAKNIYISGVWDMLHYGHMEHFNRASQYGNRLLVGVHSNEDVASYKRTPTLSLKERVKTASYCKAVSEVIPNAPLVLTEEFINKHNIHVVCCSSEYDDLEDIYYNIPRKLKILKVMDRVDGISTSELMQRVKDRDVIKKIQ